MKSLKRKGIVVPMLCAAMLTLGVSGCALEGVASDEPTTTEAEKEVVVDEVTDETTEPEVTAEAEAETETSEADEAAEPEAEADDVDGADEVTDEAAEPSTKADSNDTVTIGEWTPFNPEATAEVTGGVGIEGSEEEQLQQERIAGGAVGAVVSTNLEPLVGITDYSAGEFVPVYGIDNGAAQVTHGDANGTACSTCHTTDGSTSAGTQPPQSHFNQNLTDEECVTCHTL